MASKFTSRGPTTALVLVLTHHCWLRSQSRTLGLDLGLKNTYLGPTSVPNCQCQSTEDKTRHELSDAEVTEHYAR